MQYSVNRLLHVFLADFFLPTLIGFTYLLEKNECIAIDHNFKSDNLWTDDSKVAGKQRSGSKTPRKSKRMAAKLDGHSSTEGDITPSNSKSVSER